MRRSTVVHYKCLCSSITVVASLPAVAIILRSSPTNKAVFRVPVPSFLDANNNVLASTFRARFYDTAGTTEVRNIMAPATWDLAAPPVFGSGVDRSIVGQYWIEDSRTIYNTGTQTTGNSSPATVTPVPAYTNKVMRARAYGVISLIRSQSMLLSNTNRLQD